MKWHVNPETSAVRRCGAKTQCPFGAEAHFNSEAEAYEGALELSYELKALSRQTLISFKKVNEGVRAYRGASEDLAKVKAHGHPSHHERILQVVINVSGSTVDGRPNAFTVLRYVRPQGMIGNATLLTLASAAAAGKYFSPELRNAWDRLAQVRALGKTRRHARRYDHFSEVLRQRTGVSAEAQAKVYFGQEQARDGI